MPSMTKIRVNVVFHTVAPCSLHIIPLPLNLQLIFELFFSLWSASVVAAGCNGRVEREGGEAA